ncbi:MAG: DUF1499 domain-containing protein [Pseudomonadota bacterium]
MKWIIVVGGLGVGLFAVLALGLRLVPMPPERWHVEPADIEPRPSAPNNILMVGPNALRAEWEMEEAARRLDDVARASGAQLIQGDLAQGHATYVARTPVMGFPDAISIRLHPSDRPRLDGSPTTRIEVFSRSRFGYSDLGANQRRFMGWLDAVNRDR